MIITKQERNAAKRIRRANRHIGTPYNVPVRSNPKKRPTFRRDRHPLPSTYQIQLGPMNKYIPHQGKREITRRKAG
jgi:hypothetical protein